MPFAIQPNQTVLFTGDSITIAAAARSNARLAAATCAWPWT